MSPELFELLWKAAAVVFGAGAIWGELRGIRKDISRLETKQDKYNHLQERVTRLEENAGPLTDLPERVAVVEDSCANAHKRITELHYYENKH